MKNRPEPADQQPKNSADVDTLRRWIADCDPHPSTQPPISATTTWARRGRRIPLDQVFGARLDLLEKLVVYSGGHVRTLITFIKELLFHSHRSGLPVEMKDIERVVQPFREQARIAIWRRSVPLLDRIRRSGKVAGIRESEYADLVRYMETYVVLCYRNGDGWFEIHPLVRDYVRELTDEIAAEKATEDGAGSVS